MIPQYQLLAQRIRRELPDLDQSVRRAERGWGTAQRIDSDADVWLDSVAMSLHAFYSGLERLLERIAAQLDEGVPGGPDWHRELLRQMELDGSPRRPPVLTAETARALEDYLRFRHVVRNIYAHHFVPERVGALVSGLGALWDDLRRELERFAVFLEGVSRADDAS